jgi:AcrR family transcriptional regulator
MVKAKTRAVRPFAPPRPVRKARALSAEEWVDAGLWAMGQGANAVGVDAVARALGVTKGSFYWHFADRSAWLAAVLARWEALATEVVIARLAELPAPRERLSKLFELALLEGGRELAIEVAIASSAEPEVRRVAGRVSARRLAYVQDQYRQMGQTRAQAKVSGLLAYSAYVGVLQMLSLSPSVLPNRAAVRAYVAHVTKALVFVDSVLPADVRETRGYPR